MTYTKKPFAINTNNKFSELYAKRKEIAFIDPGIDDYQTLVNGVNPGVKVYVLDSQQDGVLQITHILQQQTELDAIHIISHGNVGYLSLGNSVLSTDTLSQYQQALFSWQLGLKQNADILIYGCEVAKGNVGKKFVQQLALITGANIAASDNLTGNAELGGDWKLNVSTSDVVAGFVLREENLKHFSSTLVTNTLDFTTYTLVGFYEATHSTTNFGTINFKVVGDVNSTLTANASLTLATVGVIDDSANDFFYTGNDGEYFVIYTDGREVDFQSLKFGSAGSTDKFSDITAYAYKDGTLLGNQTLTPAGATFPDPVGPEIVTFTNAIFENADEIRLIGTNGGFVDVVKALIDDLVLADAIVPNASPAIAINAANLAYTENAAATQIDSAGTLTDSDGDADWDGGTLKVQITANNEAADQLTITDNAVGTINTSGTNILNGGTTIGTLSAAEGTVTNGTALTITFTANATNALVQQVVQAIHYSNTSDNPGTVNRTITFTATDKNAASAVDTRTVVVSAVNDAPTNGGTFPTDIAVTEDVAGNVDLSGMTLADVDSTGSVVVTLTVTGGTLAATTGGSVTVGGSGTSTLTLTGTVANIDTFLNTTTKITYTGAANANGADAETVAVKINDGDGSGDVDLGAFNMDIAAANDLPVLGGTFTTAGTVNDNATTTPFSSVTVADVESDNVSITITYTGANGTLTGTGITGSAGSYTMTSASLASVQSNLQGLTFTPTANQVAPASTVVTTFTLTPNDGTGNGSANATTVITATSINDNPTLTGEPTDVTVTEDAASNVDLSAVSLADVDVTGADFTLVITAGAGTLTATTGGGVTVTNSGTGAITLTGTPANIDTYLNTASNIKYTSAANTNGNDATTLTLTVNDQDGSGNLNLGTVNVDITAVNDAASLNLDANDSSGAGGNNYAATFLAGGAAVKIADTDTSLTDVDDTNMETAVITLAGVLDGGNEGISISGTPATMGGVTITYTSATQIDLSGSATLADYQAVVEAIEYNNNASATGGARTVSVKMNDGDADSNTATSTITVQALPTITSATYDASTGQLVVTGTDFVAQAGVTNDLIANLLTLTGEGGTYTLTDTVNVEIGSATTATLTLSATDKLNIDGFLNKNGALSSGGTTYNLKGADGWMPQAPADESDLTGNGITVSNIQTPTVTSATYDSDTGIMVVTGTNLFKKNGAINDVDISTLTLTGGTANATYVITSASDVEITSVTSFSVTLTGADKTQVDALLDQIGTTSSAGSTYNLAAADNWLAGADAATNIADAAATITVSINPKITSATYNAGTGALVVTGTNIQANGGGSDIDASTFTFTGEGGATYTLTDTSDVNRDSATQFTLTLSATDKAAINLIVNKNGTASTSATTYNLAAADDWNTQVTVGDTSDATGNGLTASGVVAPTITSSTYDAATGALVVTGSNFLKKNGAANDIDASLFTLTGEGGDTYTLTDSADVEITSGTAFTVSLSTTDKAALNQIINKNGTASTDATTYNLAAAEDWATGADSAVAVVDATGNGVTVSNVAAPTITSSTYNTSTGVLVVTGTGFLKSGAGNDIDASLFTFTGEGGGTYTLIGTSDVEITSGTEFTITLDSTDKAAVNLLLEKAGTASTDTTTYNLAAAEDWSTGAEAAVNVVDATGNGITVTIPAPSGGGGGGTTTTTTTDTTVDGVDTSTTTETDGTTTTTITVVEDTREEDPTTISVDHADIPIVTNEEGDPILTVSIPIGVGLTVNGQQEALSAQDAIDDLIARIEQKTDANSDQRDEITFQGRGFLASLADDDTLVVQTITPTVSDGQVPNVPIIITGSDSEGDSKQALVIDVSDLPSGTIIQLDNVAFAAIVGAVRIVGGKGQNSVIGDHQNQFIVLGADDDILFGGGGDDTVGSLGGDDQTNGDAGNDIVYGGTANDIINGGTGNDQLNGGFGFDIAIQIGQLTDYQVKVLSNDVILTHSNGEVDTITDAELIQFASGSSLAVAYSDTEAAAHHLVKTWFGRDLTAEEGNYVQNLAGAEVSDVISAFHELTEAADLQNKTDNELLAGLDDNPNIIQLDVEREFVGVADDDQGFLPLGLALNADGGTGHDVLQMLGERSDVHLETVNGRLELTRLEDGAMLSLINAEAIAFDSGETVFIAHNTAEGILGRIFQSFFDRDATSAEWQSNLKSLADGVSADTILANFQSQANLSDLSDTDYVQALYSQTFGRQANTTELDNHLMQLNDGELNREWLAVEIVSSDEAITVIGNVIVEDGWV